MGQPVGHGHRQRRALGRIEICGHSGEGDGIKPTGDLGVIGDDEATCRATEALVGAHRHQKRAFGQRIGPGLARDDPALVRGVKKDERPHLVGNGPHLAHRMLEKVEACADGDELGRR